MSSAAGTPSYRRWWFRGLWWRCGRWLRCWCRRWRTGFPFIFFTFTFSSLSFWCSARVYIVVLLFTLLFAVTCKNGINVFCEFCDRGLWCFHDISDDCKFWFRLIELLKQIFRTANEAGDDFPAKRTSGLGVSVLCFLRVRGFAFCFGSGFAFIFFGMSLQTGSPTVVRLSQ